MTSISKIGNNLKVVDNEGFYDPNQKGEFKGIFHGVDVEKKYYEAGAHFSYNDLCRRLIKVQKSREYINLSSEMKPGSISIANDMSRNQLSHLNHLGLSNNNNKTKGKELNNQFMTIDPNQAQAYSKKYLLNNKETEKRSVSKDLNYHTGLTAITQSKTRNNYPVLNACSSQQNPYQVNHEKKIYTTINNNQNNAHSRNNSALRDIEKVKQRIISMDFSNLNIKKNDNKFSHLSQYNKISHNKVKSIEYTSFNEHKIKEDKPKESHLVENKIAYQTFKLPIAEQNKDRKINEPAMKLQKIDRKISSLISKLNTIIPHENDKKTLRVKTASMENIFAKPQTQPQQKSTYPIKVNLNNKGNNYIKGLEISNNHISDGKVLNKSKDKQLNTIQATTNMKSRNNAGNTINSIATLNKHNQSKSYLYSTLVKNNLNYQTINNNHLNLLQNDNTTTERKHVINKSNIKQNITKEKPLLKSKYSLL